MRKKLLVITAGTVAAGVGQEILKQMKAHPKSELDVMVRYIDTAYLPNRYGSLLPGEWFQMSIEPRYMDAIHKKLDNFPRIKSMLFPGLLPSTDVSGGGSIRYNGAGAVEIQRENLRQWLSSNMAKLAHRGRGETNISMALIVSSVGATGSGSLERLLEIIVDAAHHAGISSTTQSTIRCDVFILQPGIQEVTDLGLANTLALYAELAASQLSLSSTNIKFYQGRNIMVGWGSSNALSNIEQLKEAAATLIRLTTDPASAFAAEFQEREVDNHVLRELDPISQLPMHLSLATAVTISLGNLEEQIIEHDVARLIDSLVFARTESGSQPNILLGKFSEALAGESYEDIYTHLLDYLSEIIDANGMNARIDAALGKKSAPVKERANRAISFWQQYKDEIKQAQPRIQDQGNRFIRDAIIEMERTQRERISQGGISLTELREEFRSLQTLLASTLKVAREDTRTSVNDTLVSRQQDALHGMWPSTAINSDAKLRQLGNAMKNNMQERLRERARPTAIKLMEQLERHCAEVGRNLDIVIEKLQRQYNSKQSWKALNQGFKVGTGHPLHFVALANSKDRKEIDDYVSQVSLFPTLSKSTALGRTEDNNQLAEFRQWLEGKEELDGLFKGDLELLLKVVTSYTTEKVHEEIEKHSVIDVLLQAGDGVLQDRFQEAATMANSLVRYSKSFAPKRREAWHVSAFYATKDQREAIQKAIDHTFAEGQCRLLASTDPTEIAIFYYVDGIPMSAVDDLKGRCLDNFLSRRQQWNRQQTLLKLNDNAPVASIGTFNQRVGVPVYSGRDAEARVRETGVIQRLYEVKGTEVENYKPEDIPELGLPVQKEQEAQASQNGKTDHATIENLVGPNLQVNSPGENGQAVQNDTAAQTSPGPMNGNESAKQQAEPSTQDDQASSQAHSAPVNPPEQDKQAP